MDLLTSNMGLIHIVVSNDLKADNVQKFSQDQIVIIMGLVVQLRSNNF